MVKIGVGRRRSRHGIAVTDMTISSSQGTPTPPDTGFLLLESGAYYLLESGGKIKLESAA